MTFDGRKMANGWNWISGRMFSQPKRYPVQSSPVYTNRADRILIRLGWPPFNPRSPFSGYLPAPVPSYSGPPASSFFSASLSHQPHNLTGDRGLWRLISIIFRALVKLLICRVCKWFCSSQRDTPIPNRIDYVFVGTADILSRPPSNKLWPFITWNLHNKIKRIGKFIES